MAGGEWFNGAVSGDGSLRPGRNTNYDSNPDYANDADYTNYSNYSE